MYSDTIRERNSYTSGKISSGSGGGGGGSGVSVGGDTSGVDNSSSLFYDPFAAKRQKQHTLAQKNTLLYSVHHPVTLLITLSNPLCIPLLLNAVFPVLTGVLHTVYPISVQIPPYTDHYTVEVVFVPSSVGSVTIHGVQVVMNNATFVLRVDKDGNCCDPHRYVLIMLSVAVKNECCTLNVVCCMLNG